jgi:hypothetical protein
MGTVHDILMAQGKVAAIQSFDREIVEAASLYMSDEDSNLGFAFSGWAQCAVDSNEGGHLLQSDRGHHSNLMAAS